MLIRSHPKLRVLLILLAAFVLLEVVASTEREQLKKQPSKPNREQFMAQPVGQTEDDDHNAASEDTNINEDGVLDESELKQDGSLDLPVQSSGVYEGTLKPRPVIHFETKRVLAQEKEPEKKSILSGKFLKNTMKNAYKSTKKYVKEASDSIALTMAKSRLSSAIDEAKEDTKSVRKEYSMFTVTLSPMIESALNYMGAKDLNNLKWNPEDEFDFRLDALHSLAFGYEFMRLLNAWRESLIPVHEAYKHYVQTMRDGLSESKIQVDDGLFVHLKTIHNYLLLNGWLNYDHLSKEPMEKLEYLMSKVNTNSPNKDFERSYLRQVLRLSRIFEKTRDKFAAERKHVVEVLAAAGANSDSLPDVDEFYDQFRDALDRKQLPDIEWQVPKNMEKFLETLEPEIRLNPLVYDKHFLWRLNKGL